MGTAAGACISTGRSTRRDTANPEDCRGTCNLARGRRRPRHERVQGLSLDNSRDTDYLYY